MDKENITNLNPLRAMGKINFLNKIKARDLARMAMCKDVSPRLSQAETFAFLSSSIWTASTFRERTARRRHVSPSLKTTENRSKTLEIRIEKNVRCRIIKWKAFKFFLQLLCLK